MLAYHTKPPYTRCIAHNFISVSIKLPVVPQFEISAFLLTGTGPFRIMLKWI